MEPCPEPDAWLTLHAGLDGALERHLDRCAECRGVAAMIARLGLIGTTGSGGDHPVVPELVPAGTTFGRYVVRGAIGAGGMGVVLEAYDPQLERTVALKLVRRSRDDAGWARARDRVLEEAKAMARLAHPNVIAIHELVEIGDERLIAMEYVAGPDLETWLAGRPAAADRRRVVLEAARGLAAAHDAGVIHRDVKPSNILIGADGRARVTDFGLAALSGLATGSPAPIGTPAYTAPELAAGGPADARSDQYSFALTAWQTLFDARPGPPRPREPAVAAVLRRGFSAVPERRYASMHDLVRAIEHATRRRSRIVIAAIAGVTAIALAIAVIAWTRRDAHAAAACGPDDAAVAAAWSPALRQGWIAAMQPSAGAAKAGALAATIDRKWATWIEGGVAMCKTRRRGGIIGAGAIACVDSARRQLVAVIQHAPDPAPMPPPSPAASAAPDVEAAVAAIEDPSTCLATPAPAATPTALDPAAARQRDEVLAGLDDVSALSWLGQYKAALDRLDGLTARAPAGDPALRGELLFRRADALARTGDIAGAVPVLEEALAIDERVGDDIARVNTIILLLRSYEELGELDKATALAAIAEAAAQRIPRDPSRAARLAAGLGAIAYDAGDYAGAERHYREVVAIEEARFADKGGKDAELAGTLSNLGMAVHALGRQAEAVEIQERSVKMFADTVGEDHPDAALPVMELGELAYEAGELENAVLWYRRTIAIWEKALGKDHAYLSEPTTKLAQVESELGHHDQALGLYRRARQLAITGWGPEHPILGEAELGLAEELDRQGQRDEARTVIEHSVAVWDASKIDLPDAHLARFMLARYLWQAGDHARARTLAIAAHTALARLATPYAPTAAKVQRWLEHHP